MGDEYNGFTPNFLNTSFIEGDTDLIEGFTFFLPMTGIKNKESTGHQTHTQDSRGRPFLF